MHPVLFSIGPITVYSYGLMLAAAFLISVHMAANRAHIFALSKEQMTNLAFFLLISGIIGARILYVFTNLDYFLKHPVQVLFLHRGGLVFYGGFILAFLTGFIFVRVNRIPASDVADLFAPFIALGHAIGRIGCLLNGCCYGKVTSSPIGLMFPGNEMKVYPTQIISSVSLFLIFMFLSYAQKRKVFRWQIFLLYLIIYGIFRFSIEFLRADLYPVFWNLTITQLISIAVIIAGIICYALGSKIDEGDYQKPRS